MTVAAQVDWGDVPTWASASISLLAMVAATVAAVGAFRLYRIEQANKAREEDGVAEQAREKRRAQAAQVACWVDMAHDRAGRGATPVVHLRNASELPIYGVEVEVRTAAGDLDTVALSVLPPGASPVERPAGVPVAPSGPPMILALTIRFRDSAGVLWRRDPDGILTEVGPGR